MRLPVMIAPCVAFALMVAACSGGDGTLSRTDEAGLKAAAQESVDAFVNGDNARYYTYFAEGWRDRCLLDDFLGLMLFARVFLGDFEGAQFVVDEVRIDGERGHSGGHFELNGERLDVGADDPEDYPEYWVIEDGEWKVTSDDPTPCDLDRD